MEDKTFLAPDDVAEDLSITLEEAKGLIRELGKLLEQKGHYVIKDRVPYTFYERQKEVGFLGGEDTEKERVRLDEKRNLVSWNGKPAKYDIRDWAPDHEKLSKGITLSQTEWDKLVEYARTEPAEQPE